MTFMNLEDYWPITYLHDKIKPHPYLNEGILVRFGNFMIILVCVLGVYYVYNL